ncbi:uncharacterized protein UTRI_01115_B [Ustilago trichophora]|uniref:Uncharacterized protein n=1 Tax=Ustilago trichophora TaxID=86804 RepID=A0A5C3DWL3_9BASI|nr:uncharacterized protein UTRI_01115_B [Ustilago trichophora]
MSPQLPHQWNESGPSNSGSSSVESLRRGAPTTPPQIQLNPVAVSDATGFSDFFPWIKQNEAQLGTSQAIDDLPKSENSIPVQTEGGSMGHEHADSIAAFQQRDAAHLPRQSLQPAVSEADHSASTLDVFEDSHQMHMTSLGSSSIPIQVVGISPPSHAQADPMLGGISTSSADFYTAAEHALRQSRADPEADMLSSEDFQRLNSSNSHQHEIGSEPSRRTHSPMPAPISSSPIPPFPPSSTYPHASTLAQQSHGWDIPAPSSSNSHVGAAEAHWRVDSEVLDIFEDDKLPGYQVWRRGAASSTAMVVRIPRQMVGWKAVLMDAGGFGDAIFSSAEVSKKARRVSKVTGKQGWEVRQEALKNSYDFRRGSGIWATMHAGHRLFKHDWHVIVKDGSRYVWRMDKHALALYKEDGDVKVAEFRKAIPSSSLAVQFGDREGYSPDMEKRIGSFRLEEELLAISASSEQTGAIFDTSLALASLMAVFKARGGHQNVSAAFEPSSDPLRKKLERERQEMPDREEVMLALPRPGFARDAESILSDTTDEDADERASETLSPRRIPLSSRSPDMRPPSTQMHSNPTSSASPPPRTKGGRKRFSSLFGSGNAPEAKQEEVSRSKDRPITDSQRIARQYRTQSMFLGR